MGETGISMESLQDSFPSLITNFLHDRKATGIAHHARLSSESPLQWSDFRTTKKSTEGSSTLRPILIDVLNDRAVFSNEGFPH
jgi:hypothetical protein